MKLREKYWHKFFIVAVVIKSFTGIVETVAGFLLLAISPASMLTILRRLSGGEWAENPQDFLLAYSHQYIHHLNSGTKIFAGLYILAHGIVNLVLVWGLVKKKPAAYLIAVGVLLAFIFFQVFKIALHYSPLLFVLTVFDILFVVLIMNEYDGLIKKLGLEVLSK